MPKSATGRREEFSRGSYGVSRVEGNSNFVFGSNARFSGRLDTEVRLLHGGLAGVVAVFERRLPVTYIPAADPKLQMDAVPGDVAPS